MRDFIRFLALMATTLLVLAAVIGAIAIVMEYGVEAKSRGCQSSGGCEEMAFEARDWQTYGNLTQPIRLWMSRDLLDNVGVAGQTHNWVQANLGAPETNEKLASRCQYVYWLGPVQALVNVNSEWLCLNFEGDTVSEAVIVEK
jgi:hypothetical protein